MRREGFTLIELMVAIVLTGMVALLTYASASAGFSTSDRLGRYHTAIESQAIVRSLLLDALRHPVGGGGAAMNEVLFTIADATDSDGLPVDGLRFISRGVLPPLGTSEGWDVALTPSAGGVRLVARSIDAEEAGVEILLPDVRGLDVRVLDRSSDSTWLDRWEVLGRAPAAVSLAFLDRRGSPTGPRIVVHSALEAVP